MRKKSQTSLHKKGAKKKARKPNGSSSRRSAAVKDLFVETYAQLGNLAASAKIAKIDRRTHFYWAEKDPKYAARIDEARETAIDGWEMHAVRRATVGVEEPVYYKGEVVGHVRKMSDLLLMFVLKAARPEKFRERFEHTGPQGTPLVFTMKIDSNASDLGV